MKELLARLFSRPIIATEMIAASLFANLLALASPLFVIQVLNRYISYGVDATLATLTVGVVIAIALEFGFRQARMRLATAITWRKDETLSVRAFEVLTGAKAAAVDLLPAGLRREVLSGTDTVEQAYSPPNIAAVLDVPFALLFIGCLFLIHPLIAIIVFCFITFLFLVSIVNRMALRRPTRESTSVSGRRNALVTSAMSASDTVRAFNAAQFIRKLWHQEVQTLQRLRRRINSRNGFMQSLTHSAQALLSTTVIAVGALLVVAGEMDVGVMIGANILAARAMGPIVRLAQLGEAFAKARQSLDMFAEFVKLPQERLQGTALREYNGGLQLKDMGFTHTGANTPLFEGLSLNLEPGSVLVVSGANGSGKTTLARLLVGLIEPKRGTVLVDGVDLAQVVPEWWRRQVIYLPQEPRFLNGSVRENILAFVPELDQAGLNHVIDLAGLRRFVDESPEGIDFAITNNGDNLSLGVRRRLALARALATDGMLAVFDEPTEGLDEEGCNHVYAVMNDLAKRGRTIIAFSHDPRILKRVRFVLDLNTKPVPRLVDMQSASEAHAKAEAAANRPAEAGSAASAAAPATTAAPATAAAPAGSGTRQRVAADSGQDGS